MKKLTLRAFSDGDVPLFTKWLHADHAACWYSPAEGWLEEVAQRMDKYRWITHFIAVYDGIDIGFCQYYPYEKGGENWHGTIDTRGTYSIDYLLGEPAYLKQGLGAAMVQSLMDKVFSLPDAKQIIVQPESENVASCNTLLSAGFTYDSKNSLYVFERTESYIQNRILHDK